MDPAAAAPPSIPPEQLEEMMQLLEQMAQGLQQAMQRIEQLEAGQQELGQGLEEVTSTISSAMQPPAGGEEPMPAGGW
jgi:prefoldin subunit 5